MSKRFHAGRTLRNRVERVEDGVHPGPPEPVDADCNGVAFAAYFYLPGGRTVLSHGFPKGDPVAPQFTRAAALRSQVRQELQ